jgi:hypothetical protein
MSSDKAISRIAALLVRAEGTDNPHEADACVTRAQKLATLHSIDLAVARAHAAQRSTPTGPQQTTIAIGTAGRRGLRTFVDLFLVIARANNVKIDIARNFTSVYAYGYPEDLATTELLYTHLVTQMVTSCQQYLATGEYKSDVVARATGPDSPPAPRRVSKTSARLEFQAAFTARIHARLKAARRAAAAKTETPSGSGEIVLAGKQLEIEDYYTRHSTAKGSSYRGHEAGVRSDRSRAAGDRAAASAQLQAPAELAGAAGELEGSGS